jgi:hypothetical protein
MNDIYITENGVIKLLKDLNPHKASGPDQIPTRLFLFNQRGDEGFFPVGWNCTRVQ